LHAPRPVYPQAFGQTSYTFFLRKVDMSRQLCRLLPILNALISLHVLLLLLTILPVFLSSVFILNFRLPLSRGHLGVAAIGTTSSTGSACTSSTGSACGVGSIGDGVGSIGDGVGSTGAGVGSTGAGVGSTGAGVGSTGAGVGSTGDGVGSTGAGVGSTGAA